MFPKKRIIELKYSNNNIIKNPKMSKSISLIINTTHLNSNNISKRLQSKFQKKSYSLDKKNSKMNKNNKHSSKIYNLSMPRQNSQGVLYSLKNYMNDTQLSNGNLKYQRLNSHIINETKTPKIIELLNNKIKKKKNDLEIYNNTKDNNYHKSKTSLSLIHKQNNISQGNKDYINFDEYFNFNIFKNSRNQKIVNKIIKDYNQNYYNQKQKNKYDRYDKNKCIIERKIYGGDKHVKKNDREKKEENKTLPNNCDSIYNKILFNNIKINISKEFNLEDFKKAEKTEKNIIKNNSSNINQKNKSENKNQCKLLIKSKTNNILNTSLEELTERNKNQNISSRNKNEENIKLIFPPFNKFDINNESSQESTNQVGNTFSNKITINSNLGYRKEKFISSFLDGPEDIHYRFVELHKQRKLFYENLCNNLEEEGNNINKNKEELNDFDKSEYSEYFDNYNENVPII
jgi:hypothetical protein